NEAAMLLEGCKRYRYPSMSRDTEDRYFDEMRRIAERLGARNVPGSRSEIDAYFADIQPELRFDWYSRDTLAVLEQMPLPVPVAGLSRRTFLGAGAVLPPDWVIHRMGRTRRPRLVDRSAAATVKMAA